MRDYDNIKAALLELPNTIGLIFVFILVAMLITGGADYEEAKRAEAEYCAMVQLYKDSRGEEGWPAYNPRVDCEE